MLGNLSNSKYFDAKCFPDFNYCNLPSPNAHNGIHSCGSLGLRFLCRSLRITVRLVRAITRVHFQRVRRRFDSYQRFKGA